MSYPRRRVLIEAGMAIGILAVLLYVMLPRFMAVQKWGEVFQKKCIVVSGMWQWEDRDLVCLSRDCNALIRLIPRYATGELSCRVFVLDPSTEIRIYFGGDESNQYFSWNFSDNPRKRMTVGYWNNEITQSIVSCKILFTDSFVLTPQQWHYLRFLLLEDSQTIEGYIDNWRVLEFQLPQKVEGPFGLGSTGRVRFQDLQTKPVDPLKPKRVLKGISLEGDAIFWRISDLATSQYG